MSMLKPAAKRAAFAKVGIYGEAGAGKTFTAAQIAIGLHKYAKLTKPVAMFDTEPAASFIIPLFEKAGIDFLVFDESRALRDLMAFIDEAEQVASIVIVDSITHIWRDTQESYFAKVNEQRERARKPKLFSLEFQHWRPIKAEWAKFTDRFLSSHLHMIVCGRAASVYEYQKNETTNKMELITVGSKMATEKEMGYEPSLLIEMVKTRVNGRIVNTALIEKDRSDTLNGAEIARPTFDSFLPHIQFLNIGGEHHGSMEQHDSKELFDGDEGASSFDREKRRREIEAEELQGVFVKYGLDGSSKDSKEQRLDLLERIFGTRSWTAICDLPSQRIRDGRMMIIKEREPQPETPPEDTALDAA